MKNRKVNCLIVFFLAVFFLPPSAVKAAPGDLDLTFDAGAIVNSNSGISQVNAVVVQPDGGILIGGYFTSVNGTNRDIITRLNSDGSLDLSFNTPVQSNANFGSVIAIALQPDGKILVGGHFLIGTDVKNVVRLNANGSLDGTFSPNETGGSFVDTIVLQPDGKVIIGGQIGNYDNVSGRGIVRLNSNGTLDTPLGLNANLQNTVFSIALQTDGKIIVGGNYFVIGSTPQQNNIARLNANGTLDSTFAIGSGADNQVQGVAVQPDGKILVGGSFANFNGTTQNQIVRLNVDGSFDPSFTASITGSSGVWTIKLQPDGKILLGGAVGFVNGINRRGIARLNANGSLDSFYPMGGAGGANNLVRAVDLQADGKVLIGGDFTLVGSVSRSRIARLQGDTFLGINNVNLNEGNSGTTAFDFTVSLSSASTQAVTVNYATADGTATAPSDYQATSGTLSFAPGEISKPITVLVNGDTMVEPNETFTVNLSGATNATITSGIGTGTIINDDFCAYSTSPTNLTIGAAGGAGNTIAVTAQIGCAYTAVSNNAFITITSGASGNGNGTVIFTVAANSGAARIGTIAVAGLIFTVNQAASTTFRKTPFDFDGDGKADISIFRPSNGTWYLLQSANGISYPQWGISTDKIVPADFDGDGKTDVAIYRPSNGTWYILNSTGGITYTQWGISTDIPVPGDYDGDGKADVAIYRPSNGTWYILKSTGGVQYTQFGLSTDKIVPADYDGDGKTDIAVYRPSTGTWYFLNSATGFGATQFGLSTDKIVPADFDGDGKTDIAVYRPSTGVWYFLNSTTGFSAFQWGISTDIPAPADFDGDGKADIGVFRPSNGTWYILKSTGGVQYTQFGLSSDKPVPDAFGQ